MARRGSFRRRRNQSGNLSSLVAQLMREQRAAEDRAMFDAYQNGGLYKGRPVDDKRMRAFLASRRDGFDKADPLHDEWDNRLRQLDFQIGEQKIGLLFKQGKVGAGAMAAFYRKSLSGIPKESAFYREVAGRAADWAKSAAGAARGAARGRAVAGVNAKLAKLGERQQAYGALESIVTEAARRAGIITGDQPLTSAPAQAIQRLFATGIYRGNDRITFDDWRAGALDYYRVVGDIIATNKSINRGTKEWTAHRAKFKDEVLVGMNSVDDRVAYEIAREDYEEAVNGANGDPSAILAANRAYAATLGKIRANASTPDGRDTNSSDFIGSLANEINAVTTGQNTGPTVSDLYPRPDDPEGSDAATLAAQASAATYDAGELAAGRAFYGQAEAGGALSVLPFPAGGESDPFGRNGLDESYQPSVSRVNGERRVVWLKGQSVNAVMVRDTATGETIDPTSLTPQQIAAGIRDGQLDPVEDSSRPIGYVFTNPVNGTTRYGVLSKTGTMLFTDENPFSGSTLNLEGVDGLSVLAASYIDERGRVLPSIGNLLNRPVDLDTMDPLPIDPSMSPHDLLALLDNGTSGVTLPADQLAKYRARLQKQERDANIAGMNRDLGIADRMGVGMQSATTQGGGGDLRTNILEGMRSIQGVTSELFGGQSPASKEAFGTPPPLPSLSPSPSPQPGPAPTSLPPLPSSDLLIGTASGATAAATAAGAAAGQAAAEAATAGALLQPPKPKPLSPYDPKNTPRSGVLE